MTSRTSKPVTAQQAERAIETVRLLRYKPLLRQTPAEAEAYGAALKLLIRYFKATGGRAR